MNIEVSDLLEAYKNKLADSNHENVILTAQLTAANKKLDELEERLSRLEVNETAETEENPD
jgi:predicted nuclease with TOPRIM domain